MAGSPSVLTGDEFKFVIATWTEVLEGCVPESRLNDCYLHAKRNRKSIFPLDVSELCTAWHTLREEAEEQQRMRVLKANVCRACNGKLAIEVWSPADARNIMVDCPYHNAGKSSRF